MPSIISRILGLLALWGSYRCLRWVAAVWQWVDQNGHTEGSPAGLGVFAIGAGVDLVLLALAAALGVFGLVALFFPWKALGRRVRRESREG